MKLLRVLVLIALPLYCLAGSGCPFLEEVVNKAISPEVSVSEYQNFLQDFAQTTDKKEALADVKQCFLNQSNETLHNYAEMMVITVSSDVLSNHGAGTSRLYVCH
ncbi:mammaglobin-A-like isoform X1 [Panthera leo]|uniref:mammaglobin-A-like isoform X1 n=1 Tax=Panthera leo TaxID=9689 RepID=UPI001C699A01|nr:mammaglobin-A-like isoform X1 [Panthera leo]